MDKIEQLKEIISNYQDLGDKEITAETALADLELDSLDTVDMVMECEEKFEKEIELTEDIKTVGDLLALIEA